MGAWLGFEVARRLEARGRGPVILFASGRQAPSIGVREPYLHPLEDQAFVRAIQQRYDGIPDEVLRHPELMELLLPSLRADIEALERHVHVPAEPLSCPIVAVLGDSDRIVSVADVRSWAGETSAGFDLQVLPGGHFFFATNPGPLLDAIRRALSEASASAGR
jgi:surfactin synthase thioesterase subunit